jgi:plastocyanin
MKNLLLILIIGGSLWAKNYVVNQKHKTFIPHSIVAKVGDTITFKNSDPFAHNAYTDDEANEFDIGMQSPGVDKTIKLKAKAKFNVECAIHPNMLLEVTVK